MSRLNWLPVVWEWKWLVGYWYNHVASSWLQLINVDSVSYKCEGNWRRVLVIKLWSWKIDSTFGCKGSFFHLCRHRQTVLGIKSAEPSKNKCKKWTEWDFGGLVMVIMPKMHVSLNKFKGSLNALRCPFDRLAPNWKVNSLNQSQRMHFKATKLWETSALELSVVGETTTGGSNSELTDESSRMNSVETPLWQAEQFGHGWQVGLLICDSLNDEVQAWCSTGCSSSRRPYPCPRHTHTHTQWQV